MENKDEVFAGFAAEAGGGWHGYLAAAKALSKVRKDAARKLEKLVGRRLMSWRWKATFKWRWVGRMLWGSWSSKGFDEVAVSNIGEFLGSRCGIWSRRLPGWSCRV